MSATVKSLEIDKLDIDQRLALIGELWDSIANETETLPLSLELKSELDRRVDEADLNPNSGKPWKK